MDFRDRLENLAEKIPQQLEHIQTEEATKNALIMPFINALSYNVFDPTEVIPEFVADVGIKKGEKVDYAIVQDSNIVMLFECKTAGTNLNQVHSSQLYRYFSVTDARIGILTDGIEYRFHSDLDHVNKMDEKPFLVVDMLNLNDRVIEELKRFSKTSFDVNDIMSTASDLKYKREIGHRIEAEFQSPSEGLVRLLAGDVYSGRFTQSAIEEFTDIVKESLRLFVNSQVNRRLQSALSEEPIVSEPATPLDEEGAEQDHEEMQEKERTVTTTNEEMEGFYIVKTIMREIVKPERVFMRDTLSYCGILLDDNNRQPICRLRFNGSNNYIGLFDEDKNEERILLEKLDDIFDYADRLRATAEYYGG